VKKFVIIFCLFIFIVQLFQIIYFQRNKFTERYDAEYWKDRFEHSQYSMPLSKRTIGDDGLHAYAGYRLIKGDDPFSINNDKPPAGKYLLGLSILIFKNPLYSVLFFGFCTLIVFYFLARNFFENNVLAFFATTILFLDPLFFSQFWISGLDLTQLFFLLLNFLLMFYIRKLEKWGSILALGSGMSLGFFTEIKPPILLPLIFILETAFLLYKNLKKEYLIFILGLFLGVIIPHARFIFLGNGIIDIMKVHKYMISIYLQSNLKAHVGAVWQTLLDGKFPNVANGSLVNISEWWILWPITAFLGVVMAFYSFFSKKITFFYKGLAIFLIITLAIFTFIPAYPRYLVIVFPFLYLFGIKFAQTVINKRKIVAVFIVFLIILSYGIINSFIFLFPKSDVFLGGFYYNLSHLYFHDVFQEDIGNKSDLNLTRDQFRYIANKALNDAGVKEISIKELNKNIPIFSTEGRAKIGVTYKTQELGSFYEEKSIKLIQKNGEWKIKWDWGSILNGFRPGYELKSQIILGKRGTIINSNGYYLAKDTDSYLLSVNPEKISLAKEQAMLKELSEYGYKSGVNFQNTYLENVLPNSYIPVLSFAREVTQSERNRLLSYPGIALTPYVSRIFTDTDPKSIVNTFYQECCTAIYSSYNYRGIKGIEKDYDKDLWGYSGGKILMKDDKGAIIKVVFEKDKKDGKDVILK
jgi:hypothetical protein